MPHPLVRRALALALCVLPAGAALAAAAAAQYTPGGELKRPAEYREWVFVTSALGMTYGPNAPAAGQPAPFSNVFVSPAAYRAFAGSGRWPDGTVFMLEIRRSLENVSINAAGRTQGELVALEAAVKDAARYPDGGWAYFSFDGAPGTPGMAAASAPLPRTAACYSCHRAHGAVEWTFTQFYPTLFEIAQRKGSVRPDYDPARKLE